MSGDMVGRVIKGRYKLIDELGRGSFATVYIARDTKTNRILGIFKIVICTKNDHFYVGIGFFYFFRKL